MTRIGAGILGSFLIGVLATGHGYACQPGGIYDDPKAKGVFVVRAKVVSFDVLGGDGKTCFQVEYQVLETLYGSAEPRFDVQQCYEGDDTSRDGPDSYGFVTNAEVLAGFTRQPPAESNDVEHQPGALRWLVPTCWGPMHVSLDKLAGDEKAAAESLMQDVRSGKWSHDFQQ